MKCPKCRLHTTVSDSRKKNHLVWRRHLCKCGNKFSTYEILCEELERLQRIEGGLKILRDVILIIPK